MELQFLGTGAGQPSKQRNVSSVALKLLDELNEIWLFDVGEATQHQILRTNIRLRKITKIFISHNHGDHILGYQGCYQRVLFRAMLDRLLFMAQVVLKNLLELHSRYLGLKYHTRSSLWNYQNLD